MSVCLQYLQCREKTSDLDFLCALDPIAVVLLEKAAREHPYLKTVFLPLFLSYNITPLSPNSLYLPMNQDAA